MFTDFIAHATRHFRPVFLLLLAMPAIAAQPASTPFNASIDTSKPVTYTNPVLPGFYSDPSITKAGEYYYLVSSTFEYFPGIPVFRSKDLVNWEQIGHVIDRPEQLPDGVNIFAVTLRYHDGTFYIVTTNVGYGWNFIMTADDPAGPWSDPIWIDIPHIDPDLFFDDDGKVYVINSAFTLYEIDIKTGKVLNETGPVWATEGGRYAEGPHIYKKDGWYYLMAAEGGTEEAHSITIARSHNIAGPYYSNPANPIVTHVNRAGQQNPIQGLGHGDMIQADDGSHWMVFHGYRSVIEGGVHHTLGRETCLSPVSWPEFGWPQVNGNGTITPEMRVPTLPLVPVAPEPVRTAFDKPLGLAWNYVQSPPPAGVSVNTNKKALVLTGSAHTLGNPHQKGVSFVGRRLQHTHFKASTELHFEPAASHEKAGLTLLNNGTHFDIMVGTDNGTRYIQATFQFGEINYTSEKRTLAPGPVVLTVEGTGSDFHFGFEQQGKATVLDSVSARYLSSETIGGFTGVYVGPYATGNGKASNSEARYTWFDYKPNTP